MRLPTCLPNETLHSRICRYLAISGVKAADFLDFFFKDKRYSVHPFLNANIENLAKYSMESSIDIWRDQTLASLFTYYLPTQRNKIADLTLSNEELIRSSQISLFKEREGLIIKHCPYCAIEDIKQHGVAYWHLEHQITGMDACYQHNIWLLRQYLPNRIRIDAKLLPYTLLDNVENCTKSACQFAKFVSNKLKRILENQLTDFSHFDLLKQKGFITKKNQVRRKKLYGQLNILTKDALIPNSSLAPTDHNDFKYWSKVISNHVSQPPFKHMLLEFYLEKLPVKIQCIKSIKTDENNKKSRAQCLLLLRNGVKISDIHQNTGKSLCYIKLLAQTEGIKFEYSPLILTNKMKRFVIEMARKGFHRRVIARHFKVSAGSIEQIISATKGLVAWRKRCKYESKRRRHKLSLLRYIKINPYALRKDIKRDCNAAFFWFYLNEKEWLEDFLPRATKTRQAQRVDWNKRDRNLVEEVKIILSKTTEPITLTEIERQLGCSGWLISYKHKFPLTIALLARSSEVKFHK